MYITKHPSKRTGQWLVYSASQDWLGVVHKVRGGVLVKMFDGIDIGGRPNKSVKRFASIRDAKAELEGMKVGD